MLEPRAEVGLGWASLQPSMNSIITVVFPPWMSAKWAHSIGLQSHLEKAWKVIPSCASEAVGS